MLRVQTKSIFLALTLVLAGCGKSVLGSAAGAVSSDSSGNSSASVNTITSGTVTPISVALSWPAAAASGTVGASVLSYKVVRSSTSAAISTVAGAEAATIVMDWSPSLSTNATFLTSGLGNYFAVLAKDSAGNETLYAPILVPLPKIAAAHVQSLASGDWMLVYADINDGSRGKFVIYDAAGAIVDGPQVFAVGGVVTSDGADLGIGQQSANDVVISYQSVIDGYAHAVIVNDGNILSDVTLMNEPAVYNAHGIAAGGGANFFALTGRQNYSTIGNQGTGFSVFSTNGSSIVPMVGLNNGGAGNETRGICAASIGTNEALLLYTQGATTFAPSFELVNDAGTAVTSLAAFNTASGDTLTCAQLSNTNAVVSYRDLADGNKLKLTSYQADGTNAFAPVTYSTSGTSGAVTGFGANALVAYEDSSGGEYAIYDATGALLQAPQLFNAASFAPVDVQALSSTQAVILTVDASGDYAAQVFTP